MACALVLGRWIFFFIFERDIILDFTKIVFQPHEPRKMVLCERTGEELQIVCEVLHSA
jgi:hypothetical protein